MEKIHLASLLVKISPLSIFAFILILTQKTKKKEFYGGPGDNFPFLPPKARLRS